MIVQSVTTFLTVNKIIELLALFELYFKKKNNNNSNKQLETILFNFFYLLFRGFLYVSYFRWIQWHHKHTIRKWNTHNAKYYSFFIVQQQQITNFCLLFVPSGQNLVPKQTIQVQEANPRKPPWHPPSAVWMAINLPQSTPTSSSPRSRSTAFMSASLLPPLSALCKLELADTGQLCGLFPGQLLGTALQ